MDASAQLSTPSEARGLLGGQERFPRFFSGMTARMVLRPFLFFCCGGTAVEPGAPGAWVDDRVVRKEAVQLDRRGSPHAFPPSLASRDERVFAQKAISFCLLGVTNAAGFTARTLLRLVYGTSCPWDHPELALPPLSLASSARTLEESFMVRPPLVSIALRGPAARDATASPLPPVHAFQARSIRPSVPSTFFMSRV